MSILSKLFGYEGKIRFKCITVDGIAGEGTTFLETFNMDKKEIEEKMKEVIYVETGRRIVSVNIVGMT